MVYIITLPDIDKETPTIKANILNTYKWNKFESIFSYLMISIRGSVDESILEKLESMMFAFEKSKINGNKVIVSIPFDDKPEDILKKALKNIPIDTKYIGYSEKIIIKMLSDAFEEFTNITAIKENTMEINMTGLERIKEESKKNEILKQQEEELRNNNEGYGYKRTAFENIKKYFDTLNEVLKDTDIGDFNIPLEHGLITYKHYKRNVRTLGGTGYKAEYQNEFGYQRAIISFNKTYGKNDEGNPNLFINNGLFSKIALNWDKIQKTIEEDITERLQNRNEELEAYKKLSNTSNTNKKNKAKGNYEIGF